MSQQVWGESAKERCELLGKKIPTKLTFFVSSTVDQTHSHCVHPSSEEL